MNLENRGWIEFLQGDWSFLRILKHHTEASLLHSGLFEGIVEGTAKFTLLTRDTLLCQEAGEIKKTAGKIIKTKKEYIYLYNGGTNQIEKHFSARGEDAGIFYGLNFEATMTEEGYIIVARGEHVCIHDRYQAAYLFKQSDYSAESGLKKFNLQYRAVGPKKNYTADTVYQKCA